MRGGGGHSVVWVTCPGCLLSVEAVGKLFGPAWIVLHPLGDEDCSGSAAGGRLAFTDDPPCSCGRPAAVVRFTGSFGEVPMCQRTAWESGWFPFGEAPR